MGWFLTSKHKRRRARRKPAASSTGWDRQRTMQGLRWLGMAACVIGLAFGCRFAETALVGYTAQRGQFVTDDRVELVHCPPALHEDVRHNLRCIVALQIAADPLSGASLDRAAAMLEASPWVERVWRIERGREVVRVHAAYRLPVALVQSPRQRHDDADYLRQSDEFYPVGRSGVRLPTDSVGFRDEPYLGRHLATLGLPVIIGVAAAPPQAAGDTWPGDDLQAALSLVRLLQHQHYAHQIVAYDASARDSRGRIRLELRTAHGKVRWGLPPGQEQAVEPRAVVKLRWLAGLYQIEKAIDAHGKVVDIFGPGVIVHDPKLQRVTAERRTARGGPARYDNP